MSETPSYPWYTRGVPAAEVPTTNRRKGDDPAGYIADPDLVHAVNVALALGMPLLLTGEPGTGKTQLAYSVARDLGGCPVHKFETKSTSAARDLFYTYDALTAFKMKDGTDPRLFIRYQALGRAILEAFPDTHPKVDKLLPPVGSPLREHPGAPRRAVVLIDEIDKAPRDFPNDLLNEIDRLTFRVAELLGHGSPGSEGETDEHGQPAGVPDQFRPIVILTSNSEKGLPDAFLRRCVYFDIPFPQREEMTRIIAARLSELPPGSPMLAEALDVFYALRDRSKTRLAKEPSTAELLNWLQVLLKRGVTPGESLRGRAQEVRETLSTLVKTADDRKAAAEFVKSWAG